MRVPRCELTSVERDDRSCIDRLWLLAHRGIIGWSDRKRLDVVDKLKPKLSNAPWADWELAILDEAVKAKTPWREVAEKLPRRTSIACAVKAKNRHNKGRLNTWSEQEDAVIAKYYPAKGWKGVARNWPKGLAERSVGAIHQRAVRLGIVQKNENNPALDRALRECYSDGKMFPIQRVAKLLNIPPKKAQYRARCLGLSVRPHPVKKWTEFEIAMLEKHPELSAISMSKKLGKAGYKRTVTAVVQFRERNGLNGIGDWMSPAEVGKLLGGFNDSAVANWIKNGLLKARMRGYARDRDHFLISQESLRNFVLANPNKLRQHWALIDPMWLIGCLIAPEAGNIRTNKQLA